MEITLTKQIAAILATGISSLAITASASPPRGLVMAPLTATIDPMSTLVAESVNARQTNSSAITPGGAFPPLGSVTEIMVSSCIADDLSLLIVPQEKRTVLSNQLFS